MILSREAILACDDLPQVKVTIPEWGGTVFVRTMTAGQRDRFEQSVTDSPGVDFRARLAVLTVCDEDGKLLFSESDVALLTLRSARALSRIFSVAVKLNGITSDDVEELEKNSKAALSGGTSSGSLRTLDGPLEMSSDE